MQANNINIKNLAEEIEKFIYSEDSKDQNVFFLKDFEKFGNKNDVKEAINIIVSKEKLRKAEPEFFIKTKLINFGKKDYIMAVPINKLFPEYLERIGRKKALTKLQKDYIDRKHDQVSAGGLIGYTGPKITWNVTISGMEGKIFRFKDMNNE